jgi:hypothetical protein
MIFETLENCGKCRDEFIKNVEKLCVECPIQNHVRSEKENMVNKFNLLKSIETVEVLKEYINEKKVKFRTAIEEQINWEHLNHKDDPQIKYRPNRISIVVTYIEQMKYFNEQLDLLTNIKETRIISDEQRNADYNFKKETELDEILRAGKDITNEELKIMHGGLDLGYERFFFKYKTSYGFEVGRLFVDLIKQVIELQTYFASNEDIKDIRTRGIAIMILRIEKMKMEVRLRNEFNYACDFLKRKGVKAYKALFDDYETFIQNVVNASFYQLNGFYFEVSYFYDLFTNFIKDLKEKNNIEELKIRLELEKQEATKTINSQKSNKSEININDDWKKIIKIEFHNRILEIENKIEVKIKNWKQRERDVLIECASFCQLLFDFKYFEKGSTNRKTVNQFSVSRYGVDITIQLESGKKKDRETHKKFLKLYFS